MKLFKYILIALACICGVLAVSIFIYIQIYLTPEVIKNSFQVEVKQQLRRDVAFRDVEVSLMHGITLRGMVIHKSQPWETEDIVTCEEVRLAYRFVPLLLKKLIISTVEFKKPLLNLQFKKDRAFNIYGREKLSRGSNTLLPVLFLPAGINIMDGRVIVRDISDNMSTYFNDVEVSADALSLISPYDFTVTARLEDSSAPDIRWKGTYSFTTNKLTSELMLRSISLERFKGYLKAWGIPLTKGLVSLESTMKSDGRSLITCDGRVALQNASVLLDPSPGQDNQTRFEGLDATLGMQSEFDADQGVFTIKKLQGTVLSSAYDGNGIIREQGRLLAINAGINADALSLDELFGKIHYNPESIAAGLKFGGIAGLKISLDGKNDASLFPVFIVKLNGNKIFYPPLGSFQPEISGTVRADKKSIFVTDVKIGTKNISITLGGDITNYLQGNPRSNLKVVASKINFYDMFNGKDAPPPQEMGPFDFKGLSLSGPVKLGATAFLGIVLNNVNGAYLFEKNRFIIKDFEGEIGENGGFTLAAAVDLGVRGLDYSLTLQLSDIACKSLMPLLGSNVSQYLDGTLSGSCTLKGRGTTPASFAENLTGDATLSLGNGHIKGLTLPAQLASFIKSEELGKVVFNKATLHLILCNGSIELSSGALISPKIEVHPSGSVGLDSTLDLKATLKLSPDLFTADSKIASYLPHEGNWVTLPVLIKGTAQNPQVSLSDEALSYILQETLPRLLNELMSEQAAEPETEDNGTGEEER